MGMEFNDAADTRNRVKALQHEVKELTERLERLEAQQASHKHYPLSKDAYREGGYIAERTGLLSSRGV